MHLKLLKQIEDVSGIFHHHNQSSELWGHKASVLIFPCWFHSGDDSAIPISGCRCEIGKAEAQGGGAVGNEAQSGRWDHPVRAPFMLLLQPSSPMTSINRMLAPISSISISTTFTRQI